MLTPTEALERILARVPAGATSETSALSAAAGRVLAAPVDADVDVPPFERAMMDGYALRASDLADEGGRLPCVGESRAGAPFAGSVSRGSCVAIYTGAEVPADCDAVCMVEDTEREGDEVAFARGARSGQHVSPTGEILANGRRVFEPGRRLSPADLSVLAAVGCDPVPVRPRPRIQVLTTGDELVPPTVTPAHGQIREGNTLQLAAMAARCGALVTRTALLPDDAAALEQAFAAALDEGDALVTTGGVSMGKYDLVGAAFEAVGVEPVLHKVAIKPGKPIWFGLRGDKPVFGLPGNPVSSLLGFEVFVRPALARMEGAGEDEQRERLRRGRWDGPERAARDRQLNVPARTSTGADGVVVLAPVPFRGSADVVGAALADALVVIPADGAIATGDVVDWRPLA